MSKENQLQGRVLKNYNGYYYVNTAAIGEPEQIYTCKVKGKMKQNRFSLATGDIVSFEANGSEGMILSVLPRKNFLLRPTMANLDLFVVTFACATPDFSFIIADKLLALAELAKIPAIMVLNKVDLAKPRQHEDDDVYHAPHLHLVHLHGAHRRRYLLDPFQCVRLCPVPCTQ